MVKCESGSRPSETVSGSSTSKGYWSGKHPQYRHTLEGEETPGRAPTAPADAGGGFKKFVSGALDFLSSLFENNPVNVPDANGG